EFPDWDFQVAGLVWELRPPKMMPVMERHLRQGTARIYLHTQIVEILGGMDDPAAGKHLLAALESPAPEVRNLAIEKYKTNLPGKWKELRASKELGAAIDTLLRGDSTMIAGLNLTAAAGRVEEARRVSAIVQSVPTENVRLAAIRTLGSLPCKDA